MSPGTLDCRGQAWRIVIQTIYLSSIRWTLHLTLPLDLPTVAPTKSITASWSPPLTGSPCTPAARFTGLLVFSKLSLVWPAHSCCLNQILWAILSRTLISPHGSQGLKDRKKQNTLHTLTAGPGFPTGPGKPRKPGSPWGRRKMLSLLFIIVNVAVFLLTQRF